MKYNEEHTHSLMELSDKKEDNHQNKSWKYFDKKKENYEESNK